MPARSLNSSHLEKSDYTSLVEVSDTALVESASGVCEVQVTAPLRFRCKPWAISIQ